MNLYKLSNYLVKVIQIKQVSRKNKKREKSFLSGFGLPLNFVKIRNNFF